MSGQPPETSYSDVFAAIAMQVGVGPFLAGLAVICGWIAFLKFSNRASRAVLNKIERGETVVTDASNRTWYIGENGKRVYRSKDVSTWGDFHKEFGRQKRERSEKDGREIGLDRYLKRESYFDRQSIRYHDAAKPDYHDDEGSADKY